MLPYTSPHHSPPHYIAPKSFASLTPTLPILSHSPKNHKPQPFDGYFLDEVVTFRKKGTDNDQQRQEQLPCKEQRRKEGKSVQANDPKMAEQRAKTQLFEYSEEVIRKQFDSLQVKPKYVERLPNLSTQLSAFKQQQNSFLKELLSKKCKEKLLRCNYPSIKSISTQISCQKVWLKHKRNLATNSKNSAEEASNIPSYQSPLNTQSQTEQLNKIVCMPQQRLKLCRKAIVMSLNHKNQTQNTEQRLQRIHLSRFKKDRYRKQLKCATASHEQINQHPISLILHCKTRDTNDFMEKLRQRSTNSENGISSIKSLPKDRVTRIKSTNSDYLKQEKRRLIEGLNILNAISKESNNKLKQLPIKNQVYTANRLEIKTNKKIMSIFRKIKDQRVHGKSSLCSPDSLSSSIKINSKENLKRGCFNINGEVVKSMKAQSAVLKKVKEDVKISRRNIINSLKIFAECKKSRQVRELFSNQMHRLNSSSGILLRDRHSINE